MAVDPKRTGVKLTPVNFDECGFGAKEDQPGLAQHRGERIYFTCPGCGQFGGVNAGVEKPKQGPSWKIEAGSLEDLTTLTLSPSIHCIGCCGWHGYLKNGVFESC